MKYLFAVLFTSCLSIAASAQTDTTQDNYVKEEFLTVDTEAQFPGGITTWRRFLEKNLKTSIADSCLSKGQKTFKQTVIVSFKVDKQGLISEVIAENETDVCPLLAVEAVRVIKKGPKWVPATKDGRNVIYRQRQMITWVVDK